MPLAMQVDGNQAVGYQSMDTIVSPRCRGQGLFGRMLTAFYDASSTHEGLLLYGFPNDNSAPGFFNKLGWTRLSAVPFLIKPLRLGYFLRRIIGEKARFLDIPLSFVTAKEEGIKDILRFDARFDQFWERIAPGMPVATVRNQRYLNWRLSDHPEMHYSTKAIQDENGAILAFVSYQLIEKHGGRIGYIMEALALPGEKKPLVRLLRFAIASLRQQKADAVLAWALPHAPNYDTYRSTGFLPMPEKIRPIQLHFGVRALRGGLKRGLELRDWYISYLDSDTV